MNSDNRLLRVRITMDRWCIALVLVLFAGAWVITATLGVRDIETNVESMSRGRTSPRLDFDPMVATDEDVEQLGSATTERHDPPWHYIGPASAPFPFIVAIDESAMEAEMLGTGIRAYFVWFFGFHRVVYQRVIWNS